MRRAAPWLAAGFGGLLALAGVVVFAAADRPDEVVYGGGHAPLVPDDAYSSTLTLTYARAVVWTAGHLAGAGLAVLGLLVLAAVGGWLLGRRRPRPAS